MPYNDYIRDSTSATSSGSNVRPEVVWKEGGARRLDHVGDDDNDDDNDAAGENGLGVDVPHSKIL